MKAVYCFALLLLFHPGFSQSGKGDYYLRQAQLFFDEEKFRDAAHYGDSALMVALQKKNPDSIAIAYRMLTDIYVARKDYAKAFDNMKMETLYRDSINVIKQRYLDGEWIKALSLEKTSRLNDSISFQGDIAALRLSAKETERNSLLILAGIIGLALITILAIYRKWRQSEVNLEQSRVTVQHLNSFKEKLFTVLSYDLRNSLSSFENLTQTLPGQINKLSKEEGVQFLTNLHLTAGNLKNTLDNVIRWVAYEAKSKPFQPQPFDCKILVEQTLGKFSTALATKKLSGNVFIPDSQNVFADKEMVGIIIENLISNAIQFTPAGGSITCFSGKKDGLVTIGVKDSGIGIAEADLDKLFNLTEDFRTIGKPSHKGVGVGLILSKELVERNGGRMYVESTVGQGSNFYFTLPEKKI